MYISNIRVKDYKSFRDSGEIEFKPGINIIIGQNNSGKTTLLEALEIKIVDIPHKSFKSLVDKAHLNKQKDNSSLYISLVLVKEDLPNLSEIEDGFLFRIPFLNEVLEVIPPKTPAELILRIRAEVGETKAELEERQRKIVDEYIGRFTKAIQNKVTINFEYSNLNPSPKSYNLGLSSKKFGSKMDLIILEWIKNSSKFALYYKQEPEKGRNINNFGWDEINKFREKIYRFSAERPNLGRCIVGFDKELKPDASNLAEVLQNIKNDNPDVYEEFNKYVSEVIPSVKWVSSNKIETPSSGIGGNWNEVRVWSVNKNTRRPDLAFPLSASGTGVGQVLAILYVAIASEEPRTIIIDEPNSFLHPGAAKKLIQILNKFPQHQYFISTHSPEILSTAKPSTITRLKHIDGETVAESINLEQTKDLRETLNEIGVRFSDVFFSENILWVEGETEEKAFPLILETADQLFDVAILPLVHTDDLKMRKSKGQKHAKLVFEIYNRLSGANALTPPFVAVILDRESSSPQELADLTKEFGDKLKFIPRMMYENYLLDAEAVTHVLNTEILEDVDKVTVEQAAQWIEEQRTAKFLTKKKPSAKVLESTEWLEKVHAFELLEKLFSDLSNKTVEYRKTTHSIKITEWLLKNNPEQLAELKGFLIEILFNTNTKH